MLKDSSKSFLAKVRGYFRENWGAPFILGFIVLLVAAAVLLMTGSQWSAEKVADFAYFALVAGVVLQLVSFRKHGNSEEDGD